MKFFPFQRRVISVSWNADETAYMLSCFTRNIKDYRHTDQLNPKIDMYKFNGWVKEDKFKVSKWVKYPQNFIPIASGEIAETQNGSIVTVQYQLFPATRFLLLLSLIVSVLVLLIFGFYKQNWWVCGFTVFLFALNYVISTANFNIHVRDCHKTLEELWEL